MKIYVYTIKNGITGVVNGVVFVEHEWEVTCRLADYYSSTEDELIANGGLTYREIDNLEQLRDLSNNTDVIAFM
ncbi:MULTISPECIES: hypothetical protein [Bacillus cereus group]|jgi:hypothetical protein|uniref:Uncharacterized protein n=1 Tax=Bacillus wiedmannii TaxID=1890302 RepID=A0A242YYS8_9BACI|nr:MULTISPECIES: hypothetical protein [Bacillus cereus group]EEM19220.1 hypothetical protein bthur0001_56730 [Bacillus thuringiensis serovar tochigiensis BGSC 4Y1]PFJ30636.1 hypothetical protein COI92_06505 [Bacillus anthracis]ALL11778.1 hypothetical protein BTXL6_28385 [Bacillus thuringiensis]ALL21917.1 hypothetical protein BTXL6_10820 [Bacillus thuringiensis]MBG9749516.1 hypothetical protein [Bacillus thuringiensis]